MTCFFLRYISCSLARKRKQALQNVHIFIPEPHRHNTPRTHDSHFLNTQQLLNTPETITFSTQTLAQLKYKSYLCSTRTPKPLNNAQPTTNREQCQTCLDIAEVRRRKSLIKAQIGGRFIFIPLMRLLFDKSFMQPDDMVELLRLRGLEIDNPQRVSHYIRNIGYYRTSRCGALYDEDRDCREKKRWGGVYPPLQH